MRENDLGQSYENINEKKKRYKTWKCGGANLVKFELRLYMKFNAWIFAHEINLIILYCKDTMYKTDGNMRNIYA